MLSFRVADVGLGTGEIEFGEHANATDHREEEHLGDGRCTSTDRSDAHDHDCENSKLDKRLRLICMPRKEKDA